MYEYFVEIQFEDLYEFLIPQGFEQLPDILRRTREVVFVKLFYGQNLMIWIQTSFEQNATQRGYGEDAIRCQLWSRDEAFLADLQATKRMENWRAILQEKISALENVIATGLPCPKCEGDMKPIRNNSGSNIFWICQKWHPHKECDGKRYINNQQFIKRLLKVWPKELGE